MIGPHRDVAAARTAVRAAGFPPGARLLLGCSGGQDSLALAATLAFLAPREGWVVRVLVVDHAVRAESAADAERAAALTRSLGLETDVVRVTVPGGAAGTGHGGPEAAARSARRAALLAQARRVDADAILLGHTMDDQAETVLLGLARGSGARALAGMRERDGLWARPLLGLRRAQTAEICRALGLTPVADPSNELSGPWRQADGSALRRTALRHRAIPLLTEILGPGVVPALARSADQLRRDDDALAADAERLTEAAVRARGVGHLEIDITPLAEAPAAIRTRAIHALLSSLARPGAQVGSVHVREVERLVLREGVGPIDVAGGVSVRRIGGMLRVSRRAT
ncbi:MAG: tRNA lysidine(34) synthetase TilS [Bowdeniella nasicola]|nr:tRNA lysidine(34) synthetase TilS [Bowdeniella nasicola]